MRYEIPEGYELEHFTLKSGDFSECTELINQVFTESFSSEGGTISFTPQTFEIMFGSPIIRRDLFIRVRHLESDEIVAFVGAIPRMIKFPDGNIYNYGIPAWISVHVDHQGKGLATAMGFEILELGRKLNYDGGILFFEPEHHGKTTAIKVLGDDLKQIFLIKRFIARILNVGVVAKTIKLKWYEKLYLRFKTRLNKVTSKSVRILEEGDIPKLYELTKDFEERNEMSIVRAKEDLEWFLKLPYIQTVVHESKDGTPDAFISAWPFKMSGFGNVVDMGWIDLIHLYNLDLAEASNMAAMLCLIAKEQGWSGLQMPLIPYFDPIPFKKSRFILFPKDLEIMGVKLKGHEIPKVKSIYLDWR
jgi:GNAT superfamily N-acetyltransferase